MIVIPLSAAHSETTYIYARDIDGLCNSEGNAEKAVCEGFIAAVFEIISNSKVGDIEACVQPRTTVPRAVEIVKSWFATHRQEPMQRASIAVARAFADAFPCNK
jgi:hypothetical protein